jgi:hypothetical protein
LVRAVEFAAHGARPRKLWQTGQTMSGLSQFIGRASKFRVERSVAFVSIVNAAQTARQTPANLGVPESMKLI